MDDMDDMDPPAAHGQWTAWTTGLPLPSPLPLSPTIPPLLEQLLEGGDAFAEPSPIAGFHAGAGKEGAADAEAAGTRSQEGGRILQ